MMIRRLFGKTAALALGGIGLAGLSWGEPSPAAAPTPAPGTETPAQPGQAPGATPAPAATPAPTNRKRVDISFATHRTMDVNPEGPEFARTYFMIGPKRIAIGIPKAVRLSVGDGFILLPSDDSFDGEIHIVRSPFDIDFDLAQNVLKYREAGERGIPRGATEVEVQQPVMNPYPFNGWKSLGFTWTYSSFGRPMVRTVNYINHDLGVQILVTTLAAKKDAEKVDKLAKQFVGTWWIMPDTVQQVPVNRATPPPQ